MEEGRGAAADKELECGLLRVGNAMPWDNGETSEGAQVSVGRMSRLTLPVKPKLSTPA